MSTPVGMITVPPIGGSSGGHLSNPFYAEERQREVWNEASTVGFKLMLWLGIIAATVMIRLGRGSTVPYAIGVFAILGVASSVTIVG